MLCGLNRTATWFLVNLSFVSFFTAFVLLKKNLASHQKLAGYQTYSVTVTLCHRFLKKQVSNISLLIKWVSGTIQTLGSTTHSGGKVRTVQKYSQSFRQHTLLVLLKQTHLKLTGKNIQIKKQSANQCIATAGVTAVAVLIPKCSNT